MGLYDDLIPITLHGDGADFMTGGGSVEEVPMASSSSCAS